MSIEFNSSPSLTTAAQYVGMWFTFKKMGMPGWKGIIPFYNYYILFKEHSSVRDFWKWIIFQAGAMIAAGVGYFVIFFGAMASAGGAAYYDYSDNGYAAGGIAVGGVIAVICGIALMCGAVALIVLCCVVQFKMYAGLAAAFRLGKGWAWGLLFVPFVFFPILGFGNQFVYYGRQPEPVQEQPEVQ